MPAYRIEAGYEDSVHDVVAGYFGKRVAVALSDGSVKIIGISSSSGSERSDLVVLKGQHGTVLGVAWANPKFGLILAVCGADGQVTVWKEGKQNEWVQDYVYYGHKLSVKSIAWAPYEFGLCLACGSSDGSISVLTARSDGGWDVNRIDQAHSDGVMLVSWDPVIATGVSFGPRSVNSGQMLVSRGSDYVVKMWELDNGSWKLANSTVRTHAVGAKDVGWTLSPTKDHLHHHHQHRPRRLSVPTRANTASATTFLTTPSTMTASRAYPLYLYPAATPTPTPSKNRVSSLSLPYSSYSSKRSLPFLFLLLLSLRSLYSLLPFLRSSPSSFSIFPFSFLVSLLSFLLTLSFSFFHSQKTTFKSPIFSISSLSRSQNKLFLAKSLLLSIVFLLRFQALRYCGTAAMILAELSGNIAARYLIRNRKISSGYKSSMICGYSLLFSGLFLLSLSWDRMDCFPFSASLINQFGLLALPRQACIRIWPLLLPFLCGFLGSYEHVSMNWASITQLEPKRVRLISLFYSTVLLFVPALLSFLVFTSAEGGVSIGNLSWPLANTVVFGVLLSDNFGDEKVLSSKDFQREFLITFFCTVVLELLYFPELSLWGILFSGFLLYLAVRELDPIYSGYPELGLEPSSEPFSALVMKPIRHILSERKSRKIALFLLINTGYMVVEFVAGFMSNSLGLISDACHMLFDCAALAIGLYASYISRLPANGQFNYGRGRFEVLSGYVNAVFLVLVGALIVLESFERILDPQEISTNSLLTVSVGGLVVNLIGLVFFHEEHHHAHGGSCSHSNSHDHHQHSHGQEDYKEHHAPGGSCSHLNSHDHHQHSHGQEDYKEHHAPGGSCSHSNSHSHSHDHHHDHHHQHSHGQDDHIEHHLCSSISNDCHESSPSSYCTHHEQQDHHHQSTNFNDNHEHNYQSSHNQDRHCDSHHHDHSHHPDPNDLSKHHRCDGQHNHQHDHHHLHVDCSSADGHLLAHHSHSDNLSSGEMRLASDKGGSQKPRHRHIDHNMEGIFLHVLADTMGSVGVVVSTLLIKYKGWLVADPACSIFISVLIVASVIPLLRNSAEVLLQRVPRSQEQDLRNAVSDVKKIKGVLGVQNLHVWSFTNSDIVGTVNLRISTLTDKSSLRASVLSIFQDAGVKDLTMQLECI